MKKHQLLKAILLAVMLICFSQLTNAQETSSPAFLHQDLRIELDIELPVNKHYEMDATLLMEQFGDQSENFVKSLNGSSLKFNLDQTTKTLKLEILRPISLTEEWTVAQWNQFLESKMKRALASF